MADLKDKQIRLVGSQNFAYATGSSYTQGHVHFTTDEHGSIVVNGKVYGTTDAAYVYVGSENIPAYVNSTIDTRINALDGNPLAGDVNGKFVSYVAQKDGNITAYKNTLQTLVTVDNSEAKAYAPKGTNENVKFIKSFEIEGDTIIPKYDYFANNLPTIPSITVTDNNTGYYLPEFSASGHTITITNGAQVVSYDEFSEHLEEVKEMHELVDRFFSGAELDTETVKSYIDTLAEIQEAFKNSYAEGIANSINAIQYHGASGSNSYNMWITYATNGNSNTKQSAYVNIPYGTNTTYGLVKYDDSTIKKNSNGQLFVNYDNDTIKKNTNGQLSVNYDNNTIKKNANGQLSVNGKLTDTKYSMVVNNHEDGAYIKLAGTDDVVTTVQLEGTGIAKVSYNPTNKAIEINVPETVVNYNHHSTNNGNDHGDVFVYSGGRATTRKVISSVNLSADGKLSFSYMNLKHEELFTGSNFIVEPYNNISSSGSISIPKLTFNTCGHLTAYENITISGIAAENHSHDEFVWL